MRQHTLNAHCVSFIAELALALAFNALDVSFLITWVYALPFKTDFLREFYSEFNNSISIILTIQCIWNVFHNSISIINQCTFCIFYFFEFIATLA